MILCKESHFFTKCQLYLSQATHNTRNPQEHCNLRPNTLKLTLRKFPINIYQAQPCTLPRNCLSYRPQSQQSQLGPYIFFSFKRIASDETGALKIFQQRQDKCWCHSQVPSAGCWLQTTLPGAENCVPVSPVVSRPALDHVPCAALHWISILISCLIVQFSIHLLAESALCQATMCFSIIQLHW